MSEQPVENDALRTGVERMAARYENTSRDNWSRPDVIAANLRRLLAETRITPPTPPTSPEPPRVEGSDA